MIHIDDNIWRIFKNSDLFPQGHQGTSFVRKIARREDYPGA